MELVHPTEVRLTDGSALVLLPGTEILVREMPSGEALAEYRHIREAFATCHQALIHAAQGVNGIRPAIGALVAAVNFMAAIFPDGKALARPLLDLATALHRSDVFDKRLSPQLLPIVAPADDPLVILGAELAEAAATLPQDQWKAVLHAANTTLLFLTTMYGPELSQPMKQLVGALRELDTGQTPALLKPNRTKNPNAGWDGQHKPFNDYLFRVEMAALLDALVSAGQPRPNAAGLLCAWQGDATLTPKMVLDWREWLRKKDMARDSREIREARTHYRAFLADQKRYIQEHALSANQIVEMVKIRISQFPYVR